MGFRLTLTPATLRQMCALALMVLMTALLSACGADKELEYKEQSVYEIYSQAVVFMEDGRYTDAAKYFDEVERQHPYSVWATKAKLMSAYSYYHASSYDEAVTRLDRFIQVHPGNRDIAYAYYLKALCFYERIADIRRDQENTTKSLEALQDIITRFPDTAYGRDARLKLDLTRDHLAGREMAVGRFYLNSHEFLAAVNRFRLVVDQYSTTSHVPEALFRLTECFTAMGLRQEALKSTAVLGYNYPASDWYRDAYALSGGTKASELAAAAVGKPMASATQEAKSGDPALAVPPDSKAP